VKIRDLFHFQAQTFSFEFFPPKTQEDADELFVRPADTGKIRVNLWEANRRQLLDAGVAEARIAMIAECTACARSQNDDLRYFSHRAEHGIAGRMLNVVGVAA